jgi:hypothetical protein
LDHTRFIQGKDSDGDIFEMDLTVDTWLALGVEHVVFGYPDPGVIIDLFFAPDYPGILQVVHRTKIKKPPGWEVSWLGWFI